MWAKRLRLSPPSWSGSRPASIRSSPWSKSTSSRGPLRQTPRGPLRPQNQPPEKPVGGDPAQQPNPDPTQALSSVLHDTDPRSNSLLAPVHVPEDPNAVLKERHPAAGLLANSGLVVQRQLEMMNVLLGFEQANRYVILDAQGNHVGYMAEQEKGMGNMMARQWFRTHRAFVTQVFDRQQNEVLRFQRPFSWINSKIRVLDPLDLASTSMSTSTGLSTTSQDALVAAGAGDVRVSSLDMADMRVIGEAQQQWAPLRRKYNLFLLQGNPEPETNLHSNATSNQSASQQLQLAKSRGGQFTQFAKVDEPFLSWDFSLMSADDRLIGSVNRNFAGFAREIFTDSGMYALRMDSAGLAQEAESPHIISQTHQRSPYGYGDKKLGMTLDQRAVMLATAVSIDFDYFSRHSHGGGVMPIPFFGMGSAGEGAAAGGAAAGGTAAEGAAGAATGEAMTGAAAGAGTMAGYEAMRRSAEGQQQSPYPPDQSQQQQQGQPQQQPNPEEEVWGENEDFWGGGRGGPGDQGSAGDVGGDEDGDWDDWF